MCSLIFLRHGLQCATVYIQQIHFLYLSLHLSRLRSDTTYLIWYELLLTLCALSKCVHLLVPATCIRADLHLFDSHRWIQYQTKWILDQEENYVKKKKENDSFSMREKKGILNWSNLKYPEIDFPYNVYANIIKLKFLEGVVDEFFFCMPYSTIY